MSVGPVSTVRPAALRIAARALRGLGLGAVLLSAVIGFLFVTRGTAVRHVRAVAGDSLSVAPTEPAFPTAVALLTGAPIVAGNRVELALDGDGTFPRLWGDLRSARESIWIQSYYAKGGRVADTLARILADRASAGVVVRFLYDAFGSDWPDGYIDGLRAAGVRAVALRPFRLANLWVIQNRSHVRGIVVDARIGWTGGFGIDDKWLGGGRRPNEWRETNVRFEGPAVRHLQAAFVAAWTEATGEMLTGRRSIETYDDGVARAGLLHTAPTLGSTPAERYLALSIAGARERLYVTNAYFAPDETFVRLLTDAAARGVDVRLLVGGSSTDVDLVRHAGRARYDRLLSGGVRVYEYEGSTLHAKTFVVDGVWASIGTMNFDNRSLALNDEVTLMVLDSAAGRRMEEVYRADLAFAREITLDAFRRRPWFDRVAEWFASLITRLL